MANTRNKQMQIEDATVLWTWSNFDGQAGKYNKEGERYFVLKLTPQEADELLERGWNVRVREPREDRDEIEPLYTLNVAIRFDPYPPNIWLITTNSKQRLDEEDVQVLGYTPIAKMDVILNGHEYVTPDRSGIKAYLKTMVALVEEDDLELKYGVYDTEEQHD